jgi:hypothetical protein
MKNLYNIGFVFLLLVVLGCNCQNKLQELAEQGRTPTSSSPSVPNTSTTPTNGSSPAKTSSGGLSLNKYNQIKKGMTYQEVVSILGSEGTQVTSSGEGEYKVETYKWEDEEFQFLSVVFMGDKVYSKVESGLK